MANAANSAPEGLWAAHRSTVRNPFTPKVGFVVAIVIVLTVAAFAIVKLADFAAEARWVGRTHEVMQALERVQSLMVDAETGERGYIITGSEPFLEPYGDSIRTLDAAVTQLADLVSDDPVQASGVDALRRYVADRLTYLERGIALASKGDLKGARLVVASGQGKKAMDRIRAQVRSMLEVQQTLLDRRTRAAQRGGEITRRVLIGGAAVSLVLLVFAFVTLQREVARRTRSEVAMREANAFFDTLFESIPHMLFVKAADSLRYVRMNRAAETLFGRPRSQLLGKDDYELFSTEQAERFRSQDRTALAAEGVLDVENEDIPSAAEGIRTLHTKKLAIPDGFGMPLYLLAIAEDITERQTAQREIRRLNDSLERRARELEAVNGELEAFSYSVSHDLRAPLRAINGFALMLAEDHAERLDDEGRRLLGVVRENAQRMGHLIDDLLALSRISRSASETTVVDMNAMVAGVVRELGPGDGPTPAEYRVDPLPPVRGEPALLRQVWMNLVGNALKYSGKRERPVVEIGSDVRDGKLVYWIKDNGAGFDMRYADKLFGVFQRLHRTDEFPGTGVGLAIVRRIVERHGGRVWAEGKADEGAVFHFALPIEETEHG